MISQKKTPTLEPSADSYVEQRAKARIPIKNDNQGSIALAYNLVFLFLDKAYIYSTIRSEIRSQAKRFKLAYVPTAKIVANGLIKAPTDVKFHVLLFQSLCITLRDHIRPIMASSLYSTVHHSRSMAS